MIRKLTVVEERTYHITNTNDDELAGRRVKHKKENNLYTIVREDSTTFPGCDEDEFFLYKSLESS